MVPYDNLREKSIEQLVNEVQALSAVASQSQTQSVAALGARLTIEVAGALAELSGTVFTAKKQLVDRLDALTNELRTVQLEMGKGSAESSRHTAALVRWTKVLVGVTALYTLITAGLLLVAYSRSP